MEGAYRALDELRRAKVVKAIGVGVNESAMWCARECRRIDAVLLADAIRCLSSRHSPTFCRWPAKGNRRVLGGVFNSGILASGAVAGAKYNYRPAPDDVSRPGKADRKGLRTHGVALRRRDASRSPPRGLPHS